MKKTVDRKDKPKNNNNAGGLSTSNIFFGQDGFSMSKLEDLVGINKGDKRSFADLAKTTKPFLLNQNLLKKLHDDW